MKIDLPRLRDAIVAMPPTSAPPAYALTTLVLPNEKFERRPIHELVLTARDEVLWNGKAVDLIDLRPRLDVAEVQAQWVDLRPEPDARYETFAQVLAVIKRARLERLRLDNRSFRSSIDARVEPLPVRPRR